MTNKERFLKNRNIDLNNKQVLLAVGGQLDTIIVNDRMSNLYNSVNIVKSNIVIIIAEELSNDEMKNLESIIDLAGDANTDLDYIEENLIYYNPINRTWYKQIGDTIELDETPILLSVELCDTYDENDNPIMALRYFTYRDLCCTTKEQALDAFHKNFDTDFIIESNDEFAGECNNSIDLYINEVTSADLDQYEFIYAGLRQSIDQLSEAFNAFLNK